MNKQTFPFIAAGLGLLLMLALRFGTRPNAEGEAFLPLFTVLAISEFGFIVTAIGVFLAVQTLLRTGFNLARLLLMLACLVLALMFALKGIEYWPA